MVVLLICLVLVVVAIVVVIRLLLAELARSAAYRQPVTRVSALDDRRSVNSDPAKVRVSHGTATGAVAVTGAAGLTEIVDEGGLLVEVAPAPRQREIRQVTKVYWWRRLRSGTALVALVALLGVATAAAIGAVVLVLAFVVEQAIN